MSGLFTGLRAWTVQRITALYVLAFLVVMFIRFSIDPPYTFDAWRMWWRVPVIATATLLFFAALCLHAWVGARDVILDYVHPVRLRAAVLVLLAFGLAALGVWMVLILLAA